MITEVDSNILLDILTADNQFSDSSFASLLIYICHVVKPLVGGQGQRVRVPLKDLLHH